MERFIGFELELSSEYVRLGDRMELNPRYSIGKISERRRFYGHELYPPNPHRVEGGYFGTPCNFLGFFRNQGIDIGFEYGPLGEVYFTEVFFRISSFPYFLQCPEERQKDELYNQELSKIVDPFHIGILILNDDYILIGGILARRIN